jgi:hypothetical protein
MWRRVVGWEFIDVSEASAALIFVFKRCKKKILVEPLTPHYTASHSKFLTLHHPLCHNYKPHNIEHLTSLALRTEVRSRNLSNTDQRWRPVDCDCVQTDGDCCRVCVTPYSLEDTVRLFYCHCQDRRYFNSCTSTTWAADFPEMLGRFYETVQCPASKDGHLLSKTLFLSNVFYLHYPRHFLYRCTVHFEDSSNITHQKMHQYYLLFKIGFNPWY